MDGLTGDADPVDMGPISARAELAERIDAGVVTSFGRSFNIKLVDGADAADGWRVWDALDDAGIPFTDAATSGGPGRETNLRLCTAADGEEITNVVGGLGCVVAITGRD